MRRLCLLALLLVLAACGGRAEEASSSADRPPANETLLAPATAASAPPDGASNPAPAGEVAALVNGEVITSATLQTEMAIYEAGLGVQVADPAALTATVLEDLINRALIRQAAADLGIEISDAQIEAELAALQAEADEYGYSLDDFFAQQGITAEEFPERLRMNLIAQAVNERVTAEVPPVGTEVLARHILVGDEATAREVLQQLEAGANFEQLALEYSLDPSTREFGGNLGWIVPGDLIQAEVEAAIFALPENSRNPDPVRSVLGYHIIEVLDQAEGQPLEPEQLAQRRNQAFNAWLAQQRAAAEIQRLVQTGQ
ncbi:MAG: hypothetical protein HC915_06285 [Anaerolineae bacterium]|nr:hypothetical protein [Anaerolineae bacterium]